VEAAALPEVSLVAAAEVQTPDQFIFVAATLAAAIFCHEAGHFFCARVVGLRVEEFALGFGPEVLSFQQEREGTSFVLRLVPFGGYVRFNEAKTVELEGGELVNEFEAMSAPARLWVLAGGVVANVITAWSSLCVVSLTAGIPRKSPLPGIVVQDVGQEAFARTGLNRDDVLLRIGNLDVNFSGASVQSTVDFIHGLPEGLPVELLVRRGGQELRLDAMTFTDPDTRLQRLGVLIDSNSERLLVKAASFQEAAGMAGESVARLLGDQAQALMSLVNGTGTGEVVGPVGIVQQGEQLASAEGLFVGLGMFFVTVNLNLALLNALPVPALDGGKAAFVLLEQAAGRRLDEGKKQDVEFAFILLVSVGLLSLTAKDVSKLFAK